MSKCEIYRLFPRYNHDAIQRFVHCRLSVLEKNMLLTLVYLKLPNETIAAHMDLEVPDLLALMRELGLPANAGGEA